MIAILNLAQMNPISPFLNKWRMQSGISKTSMTKYKQLPSIITWPRKDSLISSSRRNCSKSIIELEQLSHLKLRKCIPLLKVLPPSHKMTINGCWKINTFLLSNKCWNCKRSSHKNKNSKKKTNNLKVSGLDALPMLILLLNKFMELMNKFSRICTELKEVETKTIQNFGLHFTSNHINGSAIRN